jgi:hypothetical protein
LVWLPAGLHALKRSILGTSLFILVSWIPRLQPLMGGLANHRYLDLLQRGVIDNLNYFVHVILEVRVTWNRLGELLDADRIV